MSRGFWFMRDVPLLAWALSVVAAVLARDALPWPTWLMLHLILLGAITHAILVFSGHFTNALTRTRVTPLARVFENLRLGLANIGAITVLVGVPSGLRLLTFVGAILLISAAIWHGLSLARRYRSALPGQFTGTVRYYLVAAVMLPIGSVLGVWITLPGQHGSGLVLAHAMVNVLGWVGVTVAGTLVTLWPTMLRTRAAAHSARSAARALPLLTAGVLIAAIGAATSLRLLIATGLFAYFVGMLIVARLLVATARAKTPRSAATLFAGAAVAWWLSLVLTLTVVAVVGSMAALHATLHRVAPFVVVGFAAQILIGALSYLTPVLIGGGPVPVRRGIRIMETFAKTRVVMVNVSLLVALIFTVTGVSSTLTQAAWGFTVAGIASFIPLAITAWLRQRA